MTMARNRENEELGRDLIREPESTAARQRAGDTAGGYSRGAGTRAASVPKTLDSGKAPTYTSAYKGVMDKAIKSLQGRKPFQYDYTEDPMYQQYAKGYTREGQRAMEDTLGQIAARTGGLASAYAASAAAQANNYYMQQLADKIPELRQIAYQMYQDEEDRLRQDIDLYAGLEQQDWGRYMDRMGLFNQDRSFRYGVHRDSIEDARYDREWQHQLDREAVDDARYEDETAYDRERDAISDARYEDERDYSRGRDAISDARYEDETAYGREQDARQWERTERLDAADEAQRALENQRYDAEIAYSREQDALDRELQEKERALTIWQITGTLDEGGAAVLGLQPGLKTSDREFREAELELSRQQAARSSSGRSSGGGGSRTVEPTPKLGGGTALPGTVQRSENPWLAPAFPSGEDVVSGALTGLLGRVFGGSGSQGRQEGEMSTTAQSILNSIRHINPGTSANIQSKFGGEIEDALDRGDIDDWEADYLLSLLGY